MAVRFLLCVEKSRGFLRLQNSGKFRRYYESLLKNWLELWLICQNILFENPLVQRSELTENLHEETPESQLSQSRIQKHQPNTDKQPKNRIAKTCHATLWRVNRYF